VELIIVRHGRPVRDDVSADPSLSETGLRQAERVAEHLLQEQIDHVVASTMARARQTAETLANALRLAIELRDDIREVDAHSTQYVSQEELTAESAIVQQMRNDPYSLFEDRGGWESWKRMIDSAFQELIDRDGGRRVAVFCHGMVMATYLCTVTGSPDPFGYTAGYTGLFRVKASSRGHRSLISWNETGHVRDLLAD
jgi:probable phosphoglycerate mutase